ncbi:M20 family metallopeptidase (plasmid) [Kitasatospora sp. NBC_00070]|uniref:M20 metallopeptidase family protein n=1 Tax=Kitasatospora sp. NBC_00070 TaxID=2975962 RepID=UPI002F90BDC8
MTLQGLLESAAALQAELVALRRAIHQEPEIGLHLPSTQAKVLAAVGGLGLEVTLGEKLSSITAVLRGGRPGPTVLLRGDMDALLVQEASNLPFASRVAGAMHACGHDLHTAGLVGAARLLAERRELLAGSVIFMFQPGEEGWSGAKIMIDEGVLAAAGSTVVAAYGLHVISSRWPGGVFAGRPGTAMAANDILRATLRGRSGHGSAPHLARDPIPALCEVVTALQTMVTRRCDIFDPVVVTVGNIHGGTSSNVIPDDAHFDATVRTFSPEQRERVEGEALQLVQGVAHAHGLEADARWEKGYPLTVNDATRMEHVAQTVRDLFGRDRFQPMPQPLAGAEDFSYVSEQVPSAFFFLGACPPDADPATAAYNHSSEAIFDDAVLADGAALLAALALRHLAAA